MARLGMAMGAQAHNLAVLAALGHPVLTRTSDLSWHRQLGLEVARGTQLENLLARSRTVTEGVNTFCSAAALAERHALEIPICRALHRVLFEGRNPWEAVVEVITRKLRPESDQG